MRKGYSGEIVAFKADDGLILNGFLTGKARSGTCLIHVHGMKGNFYRSRLPFAIADACRRRSMAMLSMNTRGHDHVSSSRVERGGSRTSVTLGTDLERFEDSAKDIAGAVRYMRRRGFTGFVLSGASTGCQKVAYYQLRRQDKRVKALLLFAPGDDYNGKRHELGPRFRGTVALAKKMVAQGNGDARSSRIPSSFSARRFLSVADLRNVEARLFNYDGELAEFHRLRLPICALFGSREQHALRPVREYLEILGKRTGARIFRPFVIAGGDHSFRGREAEAASSAVGWLASEVMRAPARRRSRTRRIVS